MCQKSLIVQLHVYISKIEKMIVVSLLKNEDLNFSIQSQLT